MERVVLPVFPKIQRMRERSNLDTVRKFADAMSPIMMSVGRHIQHEGAEARIDRHDATSDDIKMHEVGASTTVMRLPLRQFDEWKLLEHLREVAEQMAMGTSQMMFSTLEEVTEKTGNVVDGQGAPLSEDLIFEILSTMDFNFDQRGNWHEPTLFGGGDMTAVEALYDKVKASKRFKQLLERKRDDHRRREAGRVLVG